MVPTKTALTYLGRSIGVLSVTVCAVALSVAQTPDDKAAQDYAALLQHIADLEVTIAHQQVYIGTQEAEIASLQAQIEEVPAVIESIDPMLDKMRVAISAEIDSDLPFNPEERFGRLAGLNDILADKEARPADKMRRALGIYDAEVSYGQSVQAYSGDHPVPEKAGVRFKACEQDAASAACGLNKDQIKRLASNDVTIDDIKGEIKDGYYLRYGRLSLAYAMADETEVLRYDPDTKAWIEMSGGKALDILRAMKMARGESAPAVVEAPIYLAN